METKLDEVQTLSIQMGEILKKIRRISWKGAEPGAESHEARIKTLEVKPSLLGQAGLCAAGRSGEPGLRPSVQPGVVKRKGPPDGGPGEGVVYRVSGICSGVCAFPPTPTGRLWRFW